MIYIHRMMCKYIYIYMMVCIKYICVCDGVCVYIYIYTHMGFDQNSFIRERPFFANKNVAFAKLSRTLCLSFAGPMLANNTSYEDSFTTCQITPENRGSLFDSLLNMQLASRIPSQGRLLLTMFFWQGFLAHPLQHAL